jgi:hypothetical protein
VSSVGPPPDDPRGDRKTARKAFLLRLAPELMDELRGWSNQELRSLNAHIEYLLRDALRRRKNAKGPSDPDAA